MRSGRRRREAACCGMGKVGWGRRRACVEWNVWDGTRRGREGCTSVQIQSELAGVGDGLLVTLANLAGQGGHERNGGTLHLA